MFPILITGESGTGKEVIADLIHASSLRSSGPLIKINCAALAARIDRERTVRLRQGRLHRRAQRREGLFRQSEGGTLLLDELSEMPIDTQSKLLRVLQEKEVRPVGGRTSYKTDCRSSPPPIARLRTPSATASCARLVLPHQRRVRHLPPLRERREDILPLAVSFSETLRRAGEPRQSAGFSQEAGERLARV